MSLRLRLLLVVALAVVALIASSMAILAVVRESDAGREAAAAASNEAAVAALARAYRDRLPQGEREHPSPATEAALRAAAAGVLGTVVDTLGGYCWSDGFILEEHGPGPRGRPHGPPPPAGSGPPPNRPDGGGHGPPPELRRAITEICAKAAVGRVDRSRLPLARDTLVLAAEGVGDGVAAFTLRGVPLHPGSGFFGWSGQLGAMAAVTLAMVAVMVNVMFALRRGATELEQTLARLEGDLRAEVPRPRAKEFAAIAERLRTMAAHLADARERERSLERRLSHEARLAALGRTVAGVAHEVRNPLTGIKLLLDGIARRDVDPRTASDVATSLGEVARLDHVVTSLLSVARDARAEPVAIDLHALVDERIASVRELSSAADVTVTTDASGQVVAERDVLIRVVDNLLRNAIEASPRSTRIEVNAKLAEGDAVVDVIDAGDGIPKEREAELFEPFFTLKAAGTGLGLWLSRALAESRGGSIRYARIGGRTCFTLRLPGATPAPTAPMLP